MIVNCFFRVINNLRLSSNVGGIYHWLCWCLPVLIVVTSCAKPPEEKQIKKSADKISIQLEGSVLATEMDLIAPSDGEVKKLHVKNGDNVGDNAEILAYDKKLLKLAVDRLVSQLEAQQSTIKDVEEMIKGLTEQESIIANAKETLKNVSYLMTVGAATKVELIGAENAYAAALERRDSVQEQKLAQGHEVKRMKSAIELLEIDLKIARHNLAQADFRAPISGYVSELTVNEGQQLSRNQKIGKLVNIDKVVLKAGLASGLLPYVKEQQVTKITFLTVPQYKRTAVITRIIPVVDPKVGRMILEIELDNPDYILQPNTKALVTLLLSDDEQKQLSKTYLRNGRKKVMIQSDN